MKEGTSLRIYCKVEGSTERTLYIFWFQNGSMINYKRSRIKISKEPSGSVLTIDRVLPTDAGIYTCDPYLSKSENVTVYITKGEMNNI